MALKLNTVRALASDPAAAMTTLFAAAVLASTALAAQTQPIQTTSGPITGLQDSGIRSYKGVPYAAPPVGDLRWRKPKPHPKWNDPKACTAFGPACPQNLASNGLRQQAPESQSEDCLTLNIWAPQGAAKAPVMVWIHGGGHQQGASSLPVYDGTALAGKGVVLVSINYRLGVFGFLAHPELSREQGASGNYGYYDQIAALKWVQANIAQFGGDPASVTIFGQSAGAVSCANLMTSPLAKGLFQRVILHSGGATSGLRSLKEAEERGADLMTKAGASSLAQLRGLTTQQLLELTPAEIMSPGRGARDWPIIDGELLVQNPLDAWKAGEIAKVDLLAGATQDDGSVFARAGGPRATPAGMRQTIASAFGPDLMEDALKVYPIGTPEEARESFRHAQNDSFIMTVRRMALLADKHGSTVRHWHFTRSTAVAERMGLGAFHGAELSYVFGVLNGRMFGPQDRALGAILTEAWASFAKTGSPAAPGLPEWPLFKPGTESTMILDTAPRVVPGVRREAGQLWDRSTGF